MKKKSFFFIRRFNPMTQISLSIFFCGVLVYGCQRNTESGVTSREIHSPKEEVRLSETQESKTEAWGHPSFWGSTTDGSHKKLSIQKIENGSRAILPLTKLELYSPTTGKHLGIWEESKFLKTIGEQGNPKVSVGSQYCVGLESPLEFTQQGKGLGSIWICGLKSARGNSGTIVPSGLRLGTYSNKSSGSIFFLNSVPKLENHKLSEI